MNGDPVEPILIEELQKMLERGGIGIAQTALDAERYLDGWTQRAEYLLHFGRVFEESASDVFAADHLGGAAEIEIDPGDGEPLQLLRDFYQTGDILPGDLGHQRPAGIVLQDLPLDMRVDARVGIDPNILGEVAIGPGPALQEPPECQVGDILHRRQEQRAAQS